MRHSVIIVILAAAGIVLSACATSGQPGHEMANTARPGPAPALSTTGSALPPRHRVGAIPVDVYDVDALRQQGITSAAEFLSQVP